MLERLKHNNIKIKFKKTIINIKSKQIKMIIINLIKIKIKKNFRIFKISKIFKMFKIIKPISIYKIA